MTEQRFAFAFDPRWERWLWLTTGATPDNSVVVLDDTHFDARFGRLRCRTPLENLKDVQVTRDYRWWTAIGARGSLADHGATFGSTTVGGVCVCFHEPVGGLFGRRVAVHPGLTVTVADLEGLEAAVRQRITGRTQ